MSWDYEDNVNTICKASATNCTGTVQISSEEYRSLIEEVHEIRKLADAEHDDWYKESRLRSEKESELKRVKEELDTANSELALYKTWVKSDDTLATKFKLWKLEKEEKENEEDV